MRPGSLVQTLLLIAATSAWASVWDSPAVVQRDLSPAFEADALLPRQNGNGGNGNGGNGNGNGNGNGDNNSASSSAAPSSSQAGNNNNNNGNGNGNNNNGNGNNNGKTTASVTKTFNQLLPAGGVSMITPAAVLGPQYYKIGNKDVTEFVTFAWNFTSLSVTPTAVDIVASCSLNAQTYNIALNSTVNMKASTQAVTWDTGEYTRSGVQLPIAMYTLLIYDSQSSPDAVAKAGYLGAYNQLAFGMYTPKPNVPLDKFVCVGCNGAGSLEAHTMRFLLGMVAVTVLSFGWFTGVAGLW